MLTASSRLGVHDRRRAVILLDGRLLYIIKLASMKHERADGRFLGALDAGALDAAPPLSAAHFETT
jgi:hypothetical protein